MQDADDKPEAGDSQVGSPRYQPLVIVLVAVCAGIALDRLTYLPVAFWWGTAVVAWIGWLALWRGKLDKAASFALLLSVSATAGSWHHLRWNTFAKDDLGYTAQTEAEPVCVEAIAVTSPRSLPRPAYTPLRAIPGDERVRLDVELTGIRDSDQWRSASGQARLSVYATLPPIHTGDRLRIFGQLTSPREPQNPGEFDLAGYLRAKRVRADLRTTYSECVSILDQGTAFNPRRLLDRVQAFGRRLLDQYIHHDRSALASAILLGARDQLAPEDTQVYMETGTVHLLAISGLHVGILTGFLVFLLRRTPLSRTATMLTVAGIIFFYMLLTDARPPVIRATILVLVMCGAQCLGRRPLAFNSLAAAGLIVLAINPTDLFQAGAQLSFLAVAGLMWFGPWLTRDQDSVAPENARPDHQGALQRLIYESHPWPMRLAVRIGRGMFRLAAAGTIIWLLAMPLVMARFHIVAPVALPLNVLMWAPITTGLISGFATLVLGAVSTPLGQMCGGCCDASLWVIETVVTAARSLPGSHFWVPGPAEWWLVGFYGMLAVYVTCPRLRPPRRWCVGLLAVWIVAGFALAERSPLAEATDENAQLDCSFLAMGHGCAIVLELPSGQTVLYDAGQFGAPTMAARSIASVLWQRGITHLDAVVLSHGDIDHYNALPGLLERFSVGVVYVSPFMFLNANPALDALEAAVAASGVEMREIVAGDLIDGGNGCRIEVLHPPRRGFLDEDNANSVVLLAEHLGRRILLPGDLESPGLDALLAEQPIDCDVLLAPHHGSRRSNLPDLADWCKPEQVIISGSRRWDPTPVIETYAATADKVFHMADTGALGISIDRNGLHVERMLPTERD